MLFILLKIKNWKKIIIIIKLLFELWLLLSLIARFMERPGKKKGGGGGTWRKRRTNRPLVNMLLGPPNYDSQNSPDETHELGSWAKKWDDVPWAWTMGFDVFLCEYGLF